MQFLYQLDLRGRAGLTAPDQASRPERAAGARSMPARGRAEGRSRADRRMHGSSEGARDGSGAEARIEPLTASEIDRYLTEFLDDAEAQGQLKDEDGRAFTRRLVKGALQHKDEIDRILRRVARNWNLERMAAVDRNVLRMAVYELLHCAEVPPKVTINEAIEIAKRYSTANSGGFVNGIIDRIRIDHEQGRLHEHGRVQEAARPQNHAMESAPDGALHESAATPVEEDPPAQARTEEVPTEDGGSPSAARPVDDVFTAPRMALPRLPLPRPLSDS